MGLTYARLKDQPKKLLALTGLTRAEFDDLLVAFNKVRQVSATLTQRCTGRYSAAPDLGGSRTLPQIRAATGLANYTFKEGV